MRCLTLLLLLLLGCAASESGPSTLVDPDPDPVVDEMTIEDMMGGETGSMGGVECFTDDECREQAESQVAGLGVPFMPDRAPIGSECVMTGDNDLNHCCYYAPAACLCYYGWDGDTTRDYGNAHVLGNRETCDEYGRALDCLSGPDDFEGCDPEDDTSCEDACAALDEKLIADNARSVDAELRSAACTGNGYCHNVLRIEDRCYTTYGPAQPSYDCALSDEEILELAYPEPTQPQCNNGECDAGSAEASPAGSSD